MNHIHTALCFHTGSSTRFAMIEWYRSLYGRPVYGFVISPLGFGLV